MKSNRSLDVLIVTTRPKQNSAHLHKRISSNQIRNRFQTPHSSFLLFTPLITIQKSIHHQNATNLSEANAAQRAGAMLGARALIYLGIQPSTPMAAGPVYIKPPRRKRVQSTVKFINLRPQRLSCCHCRLKSFLEF